MRKNHAFAPHALTSFSCRKKDGRYYVVTDRWQKFTEEEVTEAESDLVFPGNFTQLKLSVVFKAFEKFFSFIINLFGDYADDFDGDLANLIKDIFGPTDDAALAA